MATDDEMDDARVAASLGRILSAGDPYTGLPLLDPSTLLLPPAVVEALLEPITDQKGAAEGLAELDADSLVPEDQIPMQAVADSSELSATFLAYAQAAKNPDLLIAGAVTVDGDDLVTSAVVEWPDGMPGVLTITARDSNDAVLAYNITHVDGATTTTYTQPTITRNANGAATNVPQIVVT